MDYAKVLELLRIELRRYEAALWDATTPEESFTAKTLRAHVCGAIADVRRAQRVMGANR